MVAFALLDVCDLFCLVTCFCLVITVACVFIVVSDLSWVGVMLAFALLVVC